MSSSTKKAIELRSRREASKLLSKLFKCSTEFNLPTPVKNNRTNIAEPRPVIENSDVSFAEPLMDTNDSTTENEIEYDVDYENGYEISFENETFSQKLCQWSIRNYISNNALNELLGILRENGINVPKDCRTLKKTPNDVIVRSMGNGFYSHYGFKDCLTDFLIANSTYASNLIEIDINIDGLPLCKSSTKQVWPILGNVPTYPEVFLIGVYEGYSKPENSNEYLSEFVEEFTDLINNGLHFKNRVFKVKLRTIIMDAPARAFVLGIKGHSGYFSCTRCTAKGEMHKNRVVFPSIDSDIRTNDSFRRRDQSEHHVRQENSIIENIDMDMIKQVPLDYMHLICLGVVKTLLKCWARVKGENYSLPSWNIAKISEKLLVLKTCVPSDFARKPRSIDDLERWKATEFRQFLLYSGPCVLKGIVSEERYTHFMNLSVATRILLDERTNHADKDFAQHLLVSFVNRISALYDKSLLSYNFHNLIHIGADAKEYGSLESVSAFRFENHLQKIKKEVKKSNNVCAQIYKRQVEKSLASSTTLKSKNPTFGSRQTCHESH
ncbi:uncharacterized protein [Musca autumnalis]|uniref:uncharacterized protein n=1 Tax=Musca autumnalis TaxID=221902 RepID=UPI003CE781B7